MKKQLLLLFLLLNLLPVINLSVMKMATISAQTMGSEGGSAYPCFDQDLKQFVMQPFPCDEEVCIQACTYQDCPYSGPCESMEFHIWVEHTNNFDPFAEDETEEEHESDNTYGEYYYGINMGQTVGDGTNNNTDSFNSNSIKDIFKNLANRNIVLKNLINKLIVNNRIRISPGTRTYYEPKNHCLFISNKDLVENKLLHELIHSVQDDILKLSYENCSINNEYEAAWLVTLCTYLQFGIHANSTLGIDEDTQDRMFAIFDMHTTENCNYSRITTDTFFLFLIYYSTGHEYAFSEAFKKICKNDPIRDEYWHSYDVNYTYNWKEMLELLGYK